MYILIGPKMIARKASFPNKYPKRFGGCNKSTTSTSASVGRTSQKTASTTLAVANQASLAEVTLEVPVGAVAGSWWLAAMADDHPTDSIADATLNAV
jgi:hypothetical protein